MDNNEECWDDKLFNHPVVSNVEDLDRENNVVLSTIIPDQIIDLEKQLLEIWSKKVLNVHKFSQDVQHLIIKTEMQEETVSCMASTITTQSLTIMHLESTNKKLTEKIARLIYVDNVHHLEKQMFGATHVNCEFNTTVGPMQSQQSTNADRKDPPITTRKDHSQPADQETARYINPPKSDFTSMQKAKQMKEIDSKDKVWISMMLEVTQNLSMKYAIPSHLRDVVEAKKKTKRPSIVPKVFGSIWRNPDLLKSAPLIHAPDPTPVIDWTQIKFKPVLPKPEHFPVQSASQDPLLYEIEKNHYGRNDATFDISKTPFGQMWGYLTNLGVVAVPNVPVGGFVFSTEQGKWVIFATARRETASPYATRRTLGGGTPGVRGRRGGERRKKPHYYP